MEKMKDSFPVTNEEFKNRLKRLTHEHPVGCYEALYNTAFAKEDSKVYLRGLGENETDISLCYYCALQCKERCGEDFFDVPAEEFSDYMCCDCPVALFYLIAVGAAEMRMKLSKYEDAEETEKMQFYEFNENFEYYALIGARSEYEAIGCYVSEVSCLDDDLFVKSPKVLSKVETIKKYFETQDKDILSADELEKIIKNNKSYTFLIDSTLV